jgi:hypothetical protein
MTPSVSPNTMNGSCRPTRMVTRAAAYLSAKVSSGWA